MKPSIRGCGLAFAFSIAVAVGTSPIAAAQETPPAETVQQPLNPGVALKGPKNGTLTDIAAIPDVLVDWEGKKKWGLERGDAVPFHYARYTVSADTKVKKGTARAGTDLFGIYYKSAAGTSKKDDDMVTLEMAEACMNWANDWQASYCGNRIWKLKPGGRRTAQYGSGYTGSSGTSPAAPDTSQYDIMEAARQSSRDAYNSGYSSSYLCGSSQRC